MISKYYLYTTKVMSKHWIITSDKLYGHVTRIVNADETFVVDKFYYVNKLFVIPMHVDKCEDGSAKETELHVYRKGEERRTFDLECLKPYEVNHVK